MQFSQLARRIKKTAASFSFRQKLINKKTPCVQPRMALKFPLEQPAENLYRLV
jgi:hypothetical protein